MSGEIADINQRRSDRLHGEPTAEKAHDLPVMPIALGDDQPISETLYTLADGRVVRAYASEEHGQQYVVEVHPVELSE